MRTSFLSRFTPSMMPKEVLEEIFVQRERLAEQTVRQVRDSVLTGPPSHTLFIGPRGIGKTHLVSLVYHRLKALPELKERLVVAWLPEDEGGIASFLDFLLAVLHALLADDPDLAVWLTPKLDALYDSREAEAEAKALLMEAVGDRSLLLLVENLDQIFAGLRDAGQKALRAFLQETRSVTLVATAQSLFGGVSRHASPFYGFFRVEHLLGLNLTEAVDLLIKIARRDNKPDLVEFLQSPAGRARVRAVDHLVAGNPRLYVIFSEFLTRESLDKLVPPFLDMLDGLTPYYQAKMHSLSPQQRKLVDFLSGIPGALPVKEIGRRTLIGATTAASQLKLLRESGYVRIAYSQGRETYYELKEPLMRLCLDVKKQRGEPIKLFVEFLRLWYPLEELKRRFAALSDNASFARASLREALRLSASEENPLFAACRADYMQYIKQGDQEKAKQVLEEWQAIGGPKASALLEQSLSVKANKLDQELNNAEEFFNQGQLEEALSILEKILTLNSQYAVVWTNKGLTLFRLGHFESALAALEQSLALDANNVNVWNIKGIVLRDMERYEKALAAFENSLTLDAKNANAWHHKATILANLSRFEEALTAFEQNISFDSDNALALYNKGIVLDNLNRFEEALTAFEQSLILDSNDANAWRSKGTALDNLERYEEALAALEQSLALDAKNADTWQSKGLTLANLDRFEEALTAFQQSLSLNSDDATAWINQGVVLASLERSEEALAATEQSLTLDAKDALAWNNMGVMLRNVGRHAEAPAAFEQSIILDDGDATAWNNKGLVLAYLGHYDEAQAAFNRAVEIQPDQPEFHANIVETQFALNQWEEGFVLLSNSLPLFIDASTDLIDATEHFVERILISGMKDWYERVKTLLEIYAMYNKTLVLGLAIVQSIPGLRSTLFSPDARRLWYETWKTQAGGRIEFTLPLRLLDVAVRYLNSGDTPDARILLELASEERSLLGPVLGIKDTEEDDD